MKKEVSEEDFKCRKKLNILHASLFSDTDEVVRKIKKEWMRWGWMMYEMSVNDKIKPGQIPENQSRWQKMAKEEKKKQKDTFLVFYETEKAKVEKVKWGDQQMC